MNNGNLTAGRNRPNQPEVGITMGGGLEGEMVSHSIRTGRTTKRRASPVNQYE